MTKTEKLLYSRAEACELLGICQVTLWRLTNKGELTPRRIGARVLYSADELRKFAGQSS